MTRTSSKKYTPTESRRLVRGAGRIFHEYISKLRTEMKIISQTMKQSRLRRVHPLLWTDVDGHLTEADRVNDQ